jgi:hypothetical protein
LGFGLIMRFTEHLQPVTTTNDYAVIVLHTLQFTRTRTSVFPTCRVFTSLPISASKVDAPPLPSGRWTVPCLSYSNIRLIHQPTLKTHLCSSLTDYFKSWELSIMLSRLDRVENTSPKSYCCVMWSYRKHLSKQLFYCCFLWTRRKHLSAVGGCLATTALYRLVRSKGYFCNSVISCLPLFV